MHFELSILAPLQVDNKHPAYLSKTCPLYGLICGGDVAGLTRDGKDEAEGEKISVGYG
jgi:hypothetical protein